MDVIVGLLGFAVVILAIDLMLDWWDKFLGQLAGQIRHAIGLSPRRPSRGGLRYQRPRRPKTHPFRW